MKIQQQGVTSYSIQDPIYKLSTEQIKSELQGWMDEFRAHNTGQQQHDCEILWGEKTGIVHWLMDEDTIELDEVNGIRYWVIINLDRWKSFERKLELRRELQLRYEKAQKIKQEADNAMVVDK